MQPLRDSRSSDEAIELHARPRYQQPHDDDLPLHPGQPRRRQVLSNDSEDIDGGLDPSTALNYTMPPKAAQRTEAQPDDTWEDDESVGEEGWMPPAKHKASAPPMLSWMVLVGGAIVLVLLLLLSALFVLMMSSDDESAALVGAWTPPPAGADAGCPGGYVEGRRGLPSCALLDLSDSRRCASLASDPDPTHAIDARGGAWAMDPNRCGTLCDASGPGCVGFGVVDNRFAAVPLPPSCWLLSRPSANEAVVMLARSVVCAKP